MTFESLPNEIVHEIFEFLDVVELFRAFHNLNSRFNSLLFTQFHTYRLNFRSILTYKSDFLVRQYLPSIVNHIISLRLSNKNEESSPPTDLFFSSRLQVSQFTYLRSLSLCYIDDEGTLPEIVLDCRQLCHLTHLKVVKCHSNYMSSVGFSNAIWALQKLTHCRLDIQDDFCIPTVVSSSLAYLSISCRFLGLDEADGIFQQTPSLCRLHVPLNRPNQLPTIKLLSFRSLTMLKLSYVRSSEAMKTLLLAVPNLTYLKVDTYDIDYDGYLWEELTHDHLPQLNVFHLRMHLQFIREKSREELVNELVSSFCTRFWLEKHRWFIHCRHMLKNNCRFILLYTVPYGFHDLDLDMLTMPYKSTYPHNTDDQLYDQVDNLSYDSSRYEHQLFIQLFNIRNLSIYLPVNKHFRDIVPSLHGLRTLTILSAKDDAQFHLQSLLNRAPGLNSLTIRSWLHSQIPVVENAHTSLRRLDIRPYRGWDGSSFLNSEECKTFSHSLLAMHCEELLINVESRDSILDLVNNMHHLQILDVQCALALTPCGATQSHRPVRYHLNVSLSFDHECDERSDDMFIKWLQDQFPAANIISKGTHNNDSVRLSIYLNNNIVNTIYLC